MTLPFSENDFVGPEDRPKEIRWELSMYGWRIYANPTVKDWLDEAAGAVVTAVRCAPKPEMGVIYVVSCHPDAPKAHKVTLSTDHRTMSWSLYTPLRSFSFPKVNKKHKAVFQCHPQTIGNTKMLVINVATYRVEAL